MARYIDKDILIDLVNRTSVYAWDTETYISAHEWVLSLIDDIPEADVEPIRHGEWIENDNNLVTYRLYELNNGESYCQEIIYPFFCSECRGGSEYKSRYCMDCGAKTDKE